MKIKSAIILSMITILVLTACGTAEPAAPTAPPATPTLVPTATNTPLPTDTPTPTLTPTPQPTPTPEVSQEELKEMYQPLIGNGLILYAVCPQVISTAERRQSGAIGGFEAFGEMIAEAAFLDAVKQALADSTATGELGEFVDQMQAHLDVMIAVLADWYNDQISSADVPGLLEDECPMVEQTLETIVENARAKGMTQDTIDLIVTELQAAMIELGTNLDDLGEGD